MHNLQDKQTLARVLQLSLLLGMRFRIEQLRGMAVTLGEEAEGVGADVVGVEKAGKASHREGNSMEAEGGGEFQTPSILMSPHRTVFLIWAP